MVGRPKKPVPVPTDEQIQKRADALRFIAKKMRYNRMDYYKPYPKQALFHAEGKTVRERLLMAANQIGKTFCGAVEMAYHLTGEYPDWWEGYRFTRPIKAWAASKTGLSTRDTVQKYLCGEPGVVDARGTGALPQRCIIDISSARGVDALADTVQVRHISGGTSILRFKSYDQGREKWQGETLDLIWFDEEPPEDIYGEGITRITATRGIVYMTFTPLKGNSDVVMRFLKEVSPDRVVVGMTIDDAPHILPEEREKIIAGYLPHEREARSRGVPTLGSGKVFTATQESITEARQPVMPAWWHYLWGIDFGIGHPFGAVLIGWDKDADVIHIMHAIRMKDAKPIEHAAAMKAYMPTAPVAWPQDGTAREKSGEVVSDLYKKAGLHMLPDHATFSAGGYGTEAGVLEMDTRLLTGRMKVAAHLSDWFEEYGLYHRKDGLIVKVRDDLLSATRIAVMMRRKAKQLDYLDNTFGGGVPKVQIAIGIDDDPWGN